MVTLSINSKRFKTLKKIELWGLKVRISCWVIEEISEVYHSSCPHRFHSSTSHYCLSPWLWNSSTSTLYPNQVHINHYINWTRLHSVQRLCISHRVKTRVFPEDSPSISSLTATLTTLLLIPFSHTCILVFLECLRHALTSGPLHWLFALPELFAPRYPAASWPALGPLPRLLYVPPQLSPSKPSKRRLSRPLCTQPSVRVFNTRFEVVFLMTALWSCDSHPVAEIAVLRLMLILTSSSFKDCIVWITKKRLFLFLV